MRPSRVTTAATAKIASSSGIALEHRAVVERARHRDAAGPSLSTYCGSADRRARCCRASAGSARRRDWRACRSSPPATPGRSSVRAVQHAQRDAPGTIVTAAVAPSAGHSRRMSANMSRKRDAERLLALRRARASARRPCSVADRLRSSSSAARRERAEANRRRRSAACPRHARAHVRHQRRCDSTATCSSTDSSPSTKPSSSSRAYSQPT